MTEEDFINKYRGNEQGFWVESACALFWARSYKMHPMQLLSMSHDYLSVPVKNRAPCSYNLANKMAGEDYESMDTT